MSLYGLASGALWKAPERRISKAGRAFTTATLRSGGDGADVQWIKLLAFSDTAQAELEGLDAGDAIAVQGNLKAEIYTPERGDARISLTVNVISVLPLKRRKRKAEASSAAPPLVPTRADFTDDIPF